MIPNKAPRARRALWSMAGALAACCYFTVLGLLFIPCLGMEGDEALFASPIFRPFAGEFFLHIGHWLRPMMVNSYFGGLKGWALLPFFQLAGTGIFAIRVPVVLAGALSIWLFFLLMRRIAGERAALMGCGLLAADATYLLTVTFDWGPVALQHLLLIAGFLLLVKFHQQGRLHCLFWGFFLLGLAMWDKALAAWMLSGVALGVIVVYPVRSFRLLTKQRIAVAVLGFVLGALPLIAYNAANHMVTFRQNVQPDYANFPAKARALRVTAEGNGLAGWMFNEEWKVPHPHQPGGWAQKASAAVADLAGHPQRHLLLYAFLAALLLTPLARGHAWRLILVALIALAVGWVQMAITANAGLSVHHTILLWPLPQLIIAISFAAASRRLGKYGLPVVSAVTLIVILSSVLVGNEYYVTAWRFGGSTFWSNGVLALAREMETVPASQVYCVDWGIGSPLRLLNHGAIPQVVDFPVAAAEYDAEQRESLSRLIADPNAIFIAHTVPFEMFPGADHRFTEFAAKAGFQRQLVRTAADSFGQPVFEVYRFTPKDE